MTDENRDELISAALDAEPVDVQALREALAAPGGRDALAAFLLVRAAVVADSITPRPAAAAAIAAARARRRLWPLGLGWRIPVGAAASIAMLLTVGAFWLGTAWQARDLTAGSGQRASQTSGTAAAPPIAAQPPASQPQAADDGVPPTPTRVLRFTPGVDWHEGS